MTRGSSGGAWAGWACSVAVVLLGCQTVDGAPARQTDESASVSAAPASGGRSGPASAIAPAVPSAATSQSVAPSASAPAALPPDPDAPCPPEMALVGRFCVDRYEAALSVVAEDGSLSPHSPYQRPEQGKRYRARSEAGVVPQAYISRVESEAACKEAGKRLCSRGEWQAACRGKGHARYPYGHQGKRGVCNTGKDHLLTKLFAKEKKALKYDEHFNSPLLNQEPGFLAKTGEYGECVSHLGVHDMVGNLHEWVSGMVDQDLVDKLANEEVTRREQPWVTGNGIFMGGFFSTTSEHGPGCDFITIAHEPPYHDYSTGFRCCKAANLPKPSPPVPRRGQPPPRK